MTGQLENDCRVSDKEQFEERLSRIREQIEEASRQGWLGFFLTGVNAVVVV